MKKFVFIVFCGIFLTGCNGFSKPRETATGVVEKAINTTLTGTLSKTNEKFYISGPGQQPKEVSSYTIKLDDYVGKKVTVKGQYSGITLFVDSIQ